VQQTLVVSGISLAGAGHAVASGVRRGDGETDSGRSRSSIETTTSPQLASGRRSSRAAVKGEWLRRAGLRGGGVPDIRP
jgi:hypothetical protein